MKKTLTILALLTFLFSCSSGPENTAKSFTENVAKGQIKEAKKYATESAGQLLDMLASMGDRDIYPDYQFKMIQDSIVDNKAWVKYYDQEGEEQTLELVKVDGKWLVHIDAQK